MNEEKSVNEEVLYVIGNGFDINLGLKTRYKNYFENFGITQMKEILELFRENEKNIDKFNQEKFEKFIKILKQYNINFDKYDSFKKNLEESVKKNDKEKIINIDAFHNSIFVRLKDEKENVFLEDYGLFIIFLLLLKVEKDEWQWVEEQISDYIKDLIDITKAMNNIHDKNINIGKIISYIIENMDEIENKIEKYTSMIIEKRKFETEGFYKNNTIENKVANTTYDFLIQILKRKTKNYLEKTEKYLNDRKKTEISSVEYENYTQKIEKLNVAYRNYTQNIRHKIRYIYFSLQIFLQPQLDLKFNNKNLEIIDSNNLRRISLKEELHRFENHFGNYALKVNEYIVNILNKDLERNITENEFIDIELSLKSEIEKKLKRIFGFETGDKQIISFNYTTYLNYYKNNSNQNIPIKNLKELINVNGNVDDFKTIRDRLRYKEKENIKEIVSNIKAETKKIKKEVELESKMMRDKQKFIEYLNAIIKSQYIERITEEKKLKNELERITGYGSYSNTNFEIEEKLKEKLKNVLNFNFSNSINTGIIFGIDEIQKDDNYKELDEFFKSKRRSRKLEEKINELLKKIFSKIYFYGHSLADADFTFFENIFSENLKIDDINQVKTELVFLYEREFFGNENIKSIVKLFYNYYSSSNRKSIKTKDEIVEILSNLRQRGILKIKIRDKTKDEYEEQDNILILDNKEKLKKLLLEI